MLQEEEVRQRTAGEVCRPETTGFVLPANALNDRVENEFNLIPLNFFNHNMPLWYSR